MKDPYTLAAEILQNEIETETRIQMFNSIDLYGNSVREKMGEDSFHLENKSGTGDITIYHVFPGIDLVYNDMHMAYGSRRLDVLFIAGKSPGRISNFSLSRNHGYH